MTRFSNPLFCCLLAILAASSAVAAGPNLPSKAPAAGANLIRKVVVTPQHVVLDGAGAGQAVLITGVRADGGEVDLTGKAALRSLAPRVVRTEGSVLRSAGDGAAIVEVRAGGQAARLNVVVRNRGRARPIGFTRDVLPVLARAGCSGAACHAKQGGKAGFQLSVLAFDPAADWEAVTRGAGGRRINRTDPGRSLLLLKATQVLPHGGGLRIRTGSAEYGVLARWIAEGAPFATPDEPKLVGVELEPRGRVLAPGARQQLLVTARYSDGSRQDVTGLAEFKSNEESIAEVDEHGNLTSTGLSGEAAVMVRFLGQVAVSRFTVPLGRPLEPSTYARLPRQNYIDGHIYDKLSRLALVPSAPCDDATFLRRAHLDLIGTLPTPDETRAFLAECEAEVAGSRGLQVAGPTDITARADRRPRTEDRGSAGTLSKSVVGHPSSVGAEERSQSRSLSPDHRPQNFKPQTPPALNTRAKLVDQLLNRPEYADFWATRWVNLLLVDRDPLFPKGAFAYDRWVRDAFRANMPFDRFARDIVTASGETYRDGPANFFRALASPEERAKSVSQLFLGVRLDCAQCHHHPFERWGQDDFYALAAVFARVRQKGSSEFERVVFSGSEGETKHPKTGQVMAPKALGGPELQVPDGEDRREALARWMTSPENPFFARAIVNRMWGLIMGRGLVEPVDDFRVTNPATNDALLDALARDFMAHGYDLKHLLRTITASAAYQRSSIATARNARDTQNYARYYPKRLIAEVLLDAVGQVTGVRETLSGHPASTRAIQLWDNKLGVEFLEVFGRPSRLSVCECDRPTDGSVTQVLHLMNSPAIQNRLASDKGMAAALDRSGKPPAEIVTELYLSAYSRLPSEGERKAAEGVFTRPGATRRTAIEDLMWVLLNSPEFVLNH